MVTSGKVMKGSAEVVETDGSVSTPGDQAAAAAAAAAAGASDAAAPLDSARPKKGSKKSKELDPLQMQMQRLKDEEARKKKQEQLRTRLAEVQYEESKMTKINALKIHDIWLRILRAEKTVELRKKVEIIAQAHERQVDRKDSIIQMLYRDLAESEEQYKLALRTNTQHVAELIELHRKRLLAVQEDFEKNLDQLKQEFQQERLEIIQNHKEEVSEIKEYMEEMEKRAKIKDNEVLQKYLHNKEAIRNHYSELLKFMTMRMRDVIEQQEKLSKSEAMQHAELMDDKYKDYQKNRQKDEQISAEIQDQAFKISEFEQQLKHWKTKWLNNLKEFEERNERLKTEKETLDSHFKKLKKNMNSFRQGQRKKLSELVMMTDAALKQLTERLTKAERLLKLAELNRRLETERERVMPFDDQSDDIVLSGEERQLLEAELLEEDASAAVAELHREGAGTAKEWNMLSKFFTKYNKVLLDKVALEQEKAQLLLENQQLRSKLKQYLDGISVNEDVLNQVNPLLVVNNVSKRHQILEQQVAANRNMAVAQNRIPIGQ